MTPQVIRSSADAVNAWEVVVVASSLERGAGLPLDPPHRIVPELSPGCGPLGGIYTGLLSIRAEWALVVACDMPLLSAHLLRHMSRSRIGWDAVVPVV